MIVSLRFSISRYKNRSAYPWPDMGSYLVKKEYTRTIDRLDIFIILQVLEDEHCHRSVAFDTNFYSLLVKNGGIVLAIDDVTPERENSNL